MKYSAKENPLNVALYKMAGHDRHGAWFARHQIMEGISFGKFEKALKREFPETLLEQGAPGAGAKRGLSADRRVERIDVDGVGRVEVYQLSAQMPSPVSPRDFLTLLLTTEKGLTEKSGAELGSGSKHVPRSYMVVSRPLQHDEAQTRPSFVRGQYESVELVREIPLHMSKSTADLTKDGEETIDPELNPVEWIMITRSDPAGGIPRFLIDRGTPGAMLTDVTKFLDWACAYETVPGQDDDLELQLTNSKMVTDEIRAQETGIPTREREANEASMNTVKPKPEEAAPQTFQEPTRDTSNGDPVVQSQDGQQETEGGMLSTVGQTVVSGVNNYALAPVAGFVNRQLGTDSPAPDDSSDTSDTSSIDSFLSAEEMRRLSTAPEAQPRESTENLSVKSASSTSLSKSEKKNMNSHEKEVYRINQQREKLDQKLAKKREAEEGKLKSSQQKEESDSSKARERMEREIRKTEERHRKEIEKLEAKKARHTKKAEERRRKRDEGEKLSQVARERDEARGQAEWLRKENDLLRDQVEGLQRENTALAGRVGKLGGEGALKEVMDEVKGGRSRSRTGASVRSERSGGGGEK